MDNFILVEDYNLMLGAGAKTGLVLYLIELQHQNLSTPVATFLGAGNKKLRIEILFNLLLQAGKSLYR
jgi:hypothetical protein